MRDFVIKTGDMIKFTFPPPLLIPPIAVPVPLVGKGSTIVLKVPACIVGDELPPPLLMVLPYTQPPFVVPGTGMRSAGLRPQPIGTSRSDAPRVFALP